MPATVLSNTQLVIRQGAAFNEYKRNHVAGKKRCQVFTGAGKATDQTESSHVTMSKLVDTAFETWANMRHEDDEQERVHLRSTSKKTIDAMMGRMAGCRITPVLVF
jgi:hypothetical protein